MFLDLLSGSWPCFWHALYRDWNLSHRETNLLLGIFRNGWSVVDSTGHHIYIYLSGVRGHGYHKVLWLRLWRKHDATEYLAEAAFCCSGLLPTHHSAKATWKDLATDWLDGREQAPTPVLAKDCVWGKAKEGTTFTLSSLTGCVRLCRRTDVCAVHDPLIAVGKKIWKCQTHNSSANVNFLYQTREYLCHQLKSALSEYHNNEKLKLK